MSITTLRGQVRSELTNFAWDQWAQMGVNARNDRNDRWAADPEALLLFTFEIGRNDPRLFDEVLDWMLTNERLVSVQRLRNLTTDENRDLVEAAIGWVAHHGPSARFRPARRREQNESLGPLFYGVAQHVRSPDEVFFSFGLLKPDTPPSGKSRPPDLDKPINFAFRLRHLFGLGSRAEVLRYLMMTSSDGAASAQSVADAASYAKRNVNETLASVVASRAVSTFDVGNERRYVLLREDLWRALFGLETGWPRYRDWPRLFAALRRLTRWLDDTRLDQLSPYMLASEARALMDELSSVFAAAGVLLPSSGSAQGEDYWPVFEESVQQVLAPLTQGWF